MTKDWLTRVVDDGTVPIGLAPLLLSNWLDCDSYFEPWFLNIDRLSTSRNSNTHVTKNDDGSLKVEVSLPGAKKSDVSVDVSDGSLTISAKRSADKKSAGAESGFFSDNTWSWSLSRDADPSKIEARLSDGVLTVTVPSAKESMRHQIDVK